MPRPAINDYTFYKIVNINADVELCYVGSTCNMKQRRLDHKSKCNNPNSPKYNLNVYTTIREHGGWDEFKIVEIGYREQITLTQSHQIEEEYRKELKATLNTRQCFQTEEETKEQKKYHSRMWYKNNKELVREQDKVYRQNNKEKIKEQTKQYRENNKERIKEYNKNKVVCECGCEINKSHISRHIKTQKHIDIMNVKTK